MKRVRIYGAFAVLGVMIAIGTETNSVLAQENVNNDWKRTTIGQVRQVLLNRGRIGSGGSPYLVSCEYPPGSGEEHVTWCGISVAGITAAGDTLMSVGAGHNSGDELHPSEAPWDTIWVVDRGETVDLGGTNEDGTETIYWPEYQPVSQRDFITRYDDYSVPNPGQSVRGEPHRPMYIDIIETVYTWGIPSLSEVLLRTYHIVPKHQDLHGVYLALQLRSQVGKNNKSPGQDDRAIYYPEHHMMTYQDSPGGPDGDAVGPIGFKYFIPEGYSESGVEFSWLWTTDAGKFAPPEDAERYRTMFTGETMENQVNPYSTVSYFSYGPFQVAVGETLALPVAQVLGRGESGLLSNATQIEEMRERDFKVPSAPPPPPLRVDPGNKRVHLNWTPTEESNPEEFQDPNRADSLEQPFEGYRLYKSTVGPDGPWTLLAEHDIAGNRYGENIGLEHGYTDTGLLNNVEYYYTVTCFSKPDTVMQWPSVEGSKSEQIRTAVPGAAPAENVKEVAVVPNPYRGDIDYTQYNPPWEQSPSARQWMEQDRKLQFINLPVHCEIRIYSAAGDFIKSITHQDSKRGYENWNMTSFVNQAIASGLYIYTVEDLQTRKTHMGKFVVIK